MKTRSLPVKFLLGLALVASIYSGASAAPPPCKTEAVVNPEVQNDVRELSGVTLNGSSSKDAASYSWKQVSGPPVTLTSANNPSHALFTAPEVGVGGASLVFELTVKGCGSQTSIKSATVNVVNVANTNLPPVASISGPEVVDEGALVTLDGSASKDPEGAPLSYSWTQVSGTTLDYTLSADGSSLSFTAPAVPYPGGASFSFKLAVSDGNLAGEALAVVNVSWVNDPPMTVALCPSTVQEGQWMTLDGSSSYDDDGDGIAAYAWIQAEGLPNADLSAVDLASANIDFFAPRLTSVGNDTMKFRLIVTDLGGLSTFDECVVKVLDITPPAIDPLADLTVEATSAEGAVASYGATAYDDFDGPVAVSCAPRSGSLFPIAETTVVCSASDAAGNTATASFVVKVQDTTPPVVTPPADVTMEATGPQTAVSPGAASAFDAVGVVALTNDAPSAFGVGTTVVTWTARDAAGNVGTATSMVTITDTTPPLIGRLDNISTVATSASGSQVFFSTTAYDLVDGNVPVVCSPASGTTFPLGTTMVGCSAADSHGNAALARFSVTVSVSWSGFLQPINVDGSSLFKVGSTIPVKFRLTGASAGITNLVARIYYSKVNEGVAGTDLEAVSTSSADSGNLFRYDPVAGQYIFNLSTKAFSQGTYQLRVDFSDGSLNTVRISSRK